MAKKTKKTVPPKLKKAGLKKTVKKKASKIKSVSSTPKGKTQLTKAKTSSKKSTKIKKDPKVTPTKLQKRPVGKPKAVSKLAKKLPTTAKTKTDANANVKRTKKISGGLVSLAPISSAENGTDAIRVQAEIVDHHPASRASNTLAPVGDALASYLKGINKYPLLSRQQEAQIAERYFKDKNPEDAEILVTSNLRFVVKVAAEYSKFGNRLIDLIQEGNVGLMHAVKEYNPYKGARLITYAVWWIRGYIQEYLMRQHSMVRIGTTQNQRKLFYHLRREKEKLDQMGQESSVKLLSARLGIPEDDIKMMEERMSGKDVSLDAPLGDDHSAARIDLSPSGELGADEILAQRETLQILEDKINDLRPSLSTKELLLLDKRLLSDNPATLQDIGTEWGVTREAVRQMEARLMKKIKQEMEKTEPVA